MGTNGYLTGNSIIKLLPHPSISASASSSSISGSAGAFPEQLSDTEEKKKTVKKKRQIAGIDQDELVDPELLADPEVVTASSEAEDSKPLNPYSMAFAVLATLYFIDFLKADKASLVGHSAGSVNTYFEAPDRVAALILVAPAIFAPNPSPKISKTEGAEEEKSDSKAQATLKLVNGMMSMLDSLYKKALSALLCSALGLMLIRMAIDKFGVVGVKNAWYDAQQVNEEIVNGYTKPLRVKVWDKALAEFSAATLAGVESKTRTPVSKRLHEITCPVLIVTDDTDRIVPAWNVKRRSQALPGSGVEVIKHCGLFHMEKKWKSL
ncbi:unnamed protein product [Linum tenue]|uniref:AB hydrolase-1 domain-containing protein n=1 Tax=Linum tenue TaxID=586396 RepID=A0AAV0NL64_9ROSI|nr:unnamed protein product [Linum tenue]